MLNSPDEFEELCLEPLPEYSRNFIGYSSEYEHYVDIYDLHINGQQTIKMINFI